MVLSGLRKNLSRRTYEVPSEVEGEPTVVIKRCFAGADVILWLTFHALEVHSCPPMRTRRALNESVTEAEMKPVLWAAVGCLGVNMITYFTAKCNDVPLGSGQSIPYFPLNVYTSSCICRPSRRVRASAPRSPSRNDSAASHTRQHCLLPSGSSSSTSYTRQCSIPTLSCTNAVLQPSYQHRDVIPPLLSKAVT